MEAARAILCVCPDTLSCGEDSDGGNRHQTMVSVPNVIITHTYTVVHVVIHVYTCSIILHIHDCMYIVYIYSTCSLSLVGNGD